MRPFRACSLQYEYSWVAFSHHHWHTQIGRLAAPSWDCLGAGEGLDQGGRTAVGVDLAHVLFALAGHTGDSTGRRSDRVGVPLSLFQGKALVGKWQWQPEDLET
jgi:hypothetical protein